MNIPSRKSYHILKWIILFLGLQWSSALTTSELLAGMTNSDIKSLPAPKYSQSVSLYDYDIETENEKSYELIQQGLGHLIGMWDFQAYRFFLAALKIDPESIMATSGAALSLMASDRHLLPQNQVALQRLLDLLNTDEGTQYERDFGNAVLMLARADMKGWGEALTSMVNEKKKGWILPALLNAYFARDGYTILGEPKYYQRKAIESLYSYCAENSDDPGPLTFYITSQLDNPNATNLYGDVLRCARKLSRLHPEYPYYHLLTGYCELRCGDPFLAEQSYIKAEELYEDFKDTNKIPFRNCKQLLDAKIGKISSLTLQENYTKAQAEATKLNNISIPKVEPPSLVQALLNWEAKSFPIRIACMENSPEAMKAEAAKIASLLKSVPFKKRELYHHFLDALRHYADTRVSLNNKSLESAGESFNRFLYSSSIVTSSSEKAISQNEGMYWSRANNLLDVLEYETKARFELTDSKVEKIDIISKITEAIDVQENTRDLMPPLWLYPMETFKADYLFSIGEYEEALDAYSKGYNRFPNHIPTIIGLEKNYRELDNLEKAEQTKTILLNIIEKQNK